MDDLSNVAILSKIYDFILEKKKEIPFDKLDKYFEGKEDAYNEILSEIRNLMDEDLQKQLKEATTLE